MRNRSFEQWLGMIERTRPERPALLALRREFAAPGAASALSESERSRVRAALDALTARTADLERAGESGGPARDGALEVQVDYRPEGMGGRGRLYLEVVGRRQLNVGEPYDPDVPDLYLFSDDSGFAGLQVDAANALPDRLEAAYGALKPLDLPPVDCPEAGLVGVHIADVLAWVSEHRVSGSR